METSARPIVHVVQHLVPGGLEVMVLELARAQGRHHPVVVVSLEGDAATAQAHWPRLAGETTPIVYMGKRPGIDLMLPLRLALLFRRLRARAVHTHHIGPLLYAGLASRSVCNLRRIHTEHDAWHLQDRKRRWLARFATEIASPAVVADAPHVADAVAVAFGGRRPGVILNGVDTTRFVPGDQAAARRALGLPAGLAIIGIAARLETVKGVDVAVRALAEVPGAILAVGGSGSQRESLGQLAQQLGVADRVCWLGHVDDTALLYQAVDVVCLPSRAEGLPLALLEAQSCGRVVVASEVGGVPAALDPQSGKLVPPENSAALARALLCALGEAATGGSGTGGPRDFVLRTASLDAMEAAYTNLIEGVAP